MVNERGESDVVREVPFPRDVPALVRALARAAGSAGGWCWLDGGTEGWSYLGVAASVSIAVHGREHEFLDVLRAGMHPAPSPTDGFFGGWVTALGYEFGVALLGVDAEPADPELQLELEATAPAFALRLDVVLALDQRSCRAELRGDNDGAINRWLRDFGGYFEGDPEPPADAPHPQSHPQSQSQSHPQPRAEASWWHSDARYAAQIAACKERIADGDAYVLCLTDTATLAGSRDPLVLYERLRESGVPTRGGVISVADRALVSASPERFLSVRGAAVETHPIKGTSPRGATPGQDAAFARELAADPKERAENLMIVDLMRNDLSRVCTPGTVRVDAFLQVETHPHVHQLVSTVSGELRAENSVIDAIVAAFPGGSMTGAPKRRAVEILSQLEAGPRSLYSGCFGWIDRGGDAELAMTIRSVEVRADRMLVGAGGGITADSDPDSELREKHLKSAPLLAVLTAARGEDVHSLYS